MLGRLTRLRGLATAGALVCAALVAAAIATEGFAASATPATAVLRVTTTNDRFSRLGKCSLREAIAAVDSPGTRTACGTAGTGSHTIKLSVGHYRLSIAPSGADDNATGDLDVTGRTSLTILGAGRATVIDAHGLGDRVLSVGGHAQVTLAHLTLTGGHGRAGRRGTAGSNDASCAAGGAGRAGAAGEGGGGVYNAGALSLRRVVVIGNRAGSGGAGGAAGSQSATAGCDGGQGGHGGDGGGVFNAGKLIVTDSSIRANEAGAGGLGGVGGASAVGGGGAGGKGGAGGAGGGIYSRGRLTVTASLVYGSHAGAGGAGGAGGHGTGGLAAGGAGRPGGGGGGVFSTRGTLRLTNTTVAGNRSGTGGDAGANTGTGGVSGDGGGLEVSSGPSAVLNATVADNKLARGGSPAGGRGSGGGIFVNAPRGSDDMRLQNTILASNARAGCAGNRGSAIFNGGHDLSYGDPSCPGRNGNPDLGSLKHNGGPTATLALGSGSAAIDKLPARGAQCPARDQRGVRRPQGKECDIGAFEFALPRITLIAPRRGASYRRGSRVGARFRCSEGGISSPIVACRGSVPRGHPIDTHSDGTKRFTVTAVDKTGHKVKKTIRYSVWAYLNPLRAVSGLSRGRIDMGVDYVGSGPLLALGDGRVTYASNNDSGPPSCYGRTCWPGGGAVVYRLLNGPFAGKYVYDAENITVKVRVGQRVRAGQRIAVLHYGSPFMETGWGSGKGPETLSIARGHQCTCGDPGGWSTIEGRNFDQLLVFVGAPSGYLQASVPKQRMPRGWPRLPKHARPFAAPKSTRPLPEGAPGRPG